MPVKRMVFSRPAIVARIVSPSATNVTRAGVNVQRGRFLPATHGRFFASASAGIARAATQRTTSIRINDMSIIVPVKPRFFATPADFRAWLEAHHGDETELLVGFYRRSTGRPSITWQESVDEALC